MRMCASQLAVETLCPREQLTCPRLLPSHLCASLHTVGHVPHVALVLRVVCMATPPGFDLPETPQGFLLLLIYLINT
jgi:hypothetical protein